MQKHTNNIQDNLGRAVVGATVLVTDSQGDPATLYAFNDVALEQKANPIVTDADGEYAFYAANGRYTIAISADGLTSEELEALLFDSAETNVFENNQSVAELPLVSGASIPVNAKLSNNFVLDLEHDGSLENPTNLTGGMVLNFTIVNSPGVSRTLDLGDMYRFPDGVRNFDTAAGAVNFMSCIYVAGSAYGGDLLLCGSGKAYRIPV